MKSAAGKRENASSADAEALVSDVWKPALQKHLKEKTNWCFTKKNA